MNSPFSDTKPRIDQPDPLIHEDAAQLADRLGISMRFVTPGKWERVLLRACHRLLDRIEILEDQLKGKT